MIKENLPEREKGQNLLEQNFCQGIKDFLGDKKFPVCHTLLIPKENLQGLGGPACLGINRDPKLVVEIGGFSPNAYFLRLVGDKLYLSFEVTTGEFPLTIKIIGYDETNPWLRLVEEAERTQLLAFGIKVLETLKRKREALAEAE